MDVAQQQQSMSSLEGEGEPLGDSDYKQPGLDFLSDNDDSEVSDDSRPGHGRQAPSDFATSSKNSMSHAHLR